jgi:hypothetical protein
MLPQIGVSLVKDGDEHRLQLSKLRAVLGSAGKQGHAPLILWKDAPRQQAPP